MARADVVGSGPHHRSRAFRLHRRALRPPGGAGIEETIE